MRLGFIRCINVYYYKLFTRKFIKQVIPSSLLRKPEGKKIFKSIESNARKFRHKKIFNKNRKFMPFKQRSMGFKSKSHCKNKNFKAFSGDCTKDQKLSLKLKSFFPIGQNIYSLMACFRMKQQWKKYRKQLKKLKYSYLFKKHKKSFKDYSQKEFLKFEKDFEVIQNRYDSWDLKKKNEHKKHFKLIKGKYLLKKSENIKFMTYNEYNFINNYNYFYVANTNKKEFLYFKKLYINLSLKLKKKYRSLYLDSLNSRNYFINKINPNLNKSLYSYVIWEEENLIPGFPIEIFFYKVCKSYQRFITIEIKYIYKLIFNLIRTYFPKGKKHFKELKRNYLSIKKYENKKDKLFLHIINKIKKTTLKRKYQVSLLYDKEEEEGIEKIFKTSLNDLFGDLIKYQNILYELNVWVNKKYINKKYINKKHINKKHINKKHINNKKGYYFIISFIILFFKFINSRLLKTYKFSNFFFNYNLKYFKKYQVYFYKYKFFKYI